MNSRFKPASAEELARRGIGSASVEPAPVEEVAVEETPAEAEDTPAEGE